MSPQECSCTLVLPVRLSTIKQVELSTGGVPPALQGDVRQPWLRHYPGMNSVMLLLMLPLMLHLMLHLLLHLLLYQLLLLRSPWRC